MIKFFNIFKKDKKVETVKIRDLITSTQQPQESETSPTKEDIRPPIDPRILYLGTYYHNIRGTIHIGVKLADRMRHIAIFGGTGMGKTTLLVNMAVQDILNGYGICFIDPKGDAIEEILMRIPPERIKDVILIDPANYNKVIGLNFLEVPKKNIKEDQIAALKEVIVADIVALMRQQTRIWGERFGRIFETLIRAILDFNERAPEDEQLTFIDLYILLTDDDVRSKFVEHVDDPIIREYLLKVNEMDEEVLEPVIRRLNDLVMNKIARQMIAHRQSSFDFREAIDTNKIILVRIPKGEVGESVMQLIGTAVISRIWAAAKSRVNIPPEERKPFFLYVDEFKNFAFEGSTFDEILSEARAFKLGLVLATQYPSQLSKPVEDAVYANCGTIIAFNPQNPKDAKILIKRFPNVKEEELLSLGLYKAMVRVMVDNQLTDPIVIRTYPPPPVIRGRDEIIDVAEESLKNYGVERIDELTLSHTVRKIKELCERGLKKGLINELLEVLYALVLRGIEVNSITFKEEAKNRGITVDDRKYNAFLELAEKAGYIKLVTDVATGKLSVIPILDEIRKAFWADKLSEPTDGFVKHKKLVQTVYEFFTKIGYVVEVPNPGACKAIFDDDYCPDLILRTPLDPEGREKCYKIFSLKDKICVEVEVSTAFRPGLILNKLAKAYKAGYFLVFVVEGHGTTLEEYISAAKYIMSVIEGMRGKHGFYKTEEIEVDEKGRKLWIHRASGEIAYEKGGALYRKMDNAYICTVQEARDRGWMYKRVEFNPAEVFKDTKTPTYSEDCIVVIFPAEGLPLPVTALTKGTSSLHLLELNPSGSNKEVTDKIKEVLRVKAIELGKTVVSRLISDFGDEDDKGGEAT